MKIKPSITRNERPLPGVTRERKVTRAGSVLMAFLFLAAAGPGARASGAGRSCCARALDTQKFSDASLYQLDSVWTTDAGNETRLGTLSRKPRLLLMFYSRCTTACPILESNLRELESSLPIQARTNVDVTLVSFDSERDTPAELAKYRKAWNLPADWELLSGKNDDVRELAALLGIQFKKTADAGFAHSNVITLLNQDGEVVFQQTGLEAKPDEMRRKIAQLLK